MGAGAVVAILVGILVFLGGGGAGAYLLLGGSGLSDDVDQSAALKVKVLALLSATRAGDPQKAEDPLLDLMIIPAKAEAWFKESFGPKDAKDLYETWNRDVFADLPNFITPFKNAIRKGQSELRITRLASVGDVQRCALAFCGAHRVDETRIFKAMKTPRALYIVRFAKPGSAQGGIDEDELFYFAIVNGQFAFIGMLFPLSF